MNSKIHEKHPNIPENLTIPVVFIDPVLQIFKDPCESKTISISDREKEMFDNYTSRFIKFYGYISRLGMLRVATGRVGSGNSKYPRVNG